MQTPDFNPLSIKQDASVRQLPPLAIVSFRPSHILWLLQLSCYLFFCLFTCMALWGYLPHNLRWLGFLLVLCACFLKFGRHHCAEQHSGDLSYSSRGWLLQRQGELLPLALRGEVLMWSWLIVLQFEVSTTQQQVRLVICKDSVSAADFSRLRCWLKACLTPRD